MQVIGRTDPVGGAPLLADTLLNGNEIEREAVRHGLLAAGPMAVTALAAKAGEGSRTQRSLLRRHISSFAARDPERTAQLGKLIAQADARSDKESLFDLLRAGASRPALHAQISKITARRYPQSKTFPDRYRLLALMGRFRCVDFQTQLIAASADPDHLIRAIAITGLGACDNPGGEAIGMISQALNDGTPEVRLAALHAMDEDSVNDGFPPILIRLAESDSWPMVRAQVAVEAGRVRPAHAIPILEIAIRDSSAKVREAALKSSIAISAPQVDKLIEERLLDPDELPQVKRTAANAAAMRCGVTALAALFTMLQKGAEPLAAPEDVSSAVAAARAMGTIGGKQAEELLMEAKKRSNPATDRAIGAALRDIGRSCIAR
jgi:HEAT repeat protein